MNQLLNKKIPDLKPEARTRLASVTKCSLEIADAAVSELHMWV